MLNRDRLALALDIHARSYKLLKWIGAAIDDGRIPAAKAARHADDPTAANAWIESNYGLIPADIRPARFLAANLRRHRRGEPAEISRFTCYLGVLTLAVMWPMLPVLLGALLGLWPLPR